MNCEYHGEFNNTFCPVCLYYEKRPELFCQTCRQYLKKIRVDLPGEPKSHAVAEMCPRCEDESAVVEEIRRTHLKEKYPDTVEIDGKIVQARVTEREAAGLGGPRYVSRMLPVLRPDLVLDVISALRSKRRFTLASVREDMARVLQKYPEYDSDNTQSQDVVAKMLAGIDESLMTRTEKHVHYWDQTAGREASHGTVEYDLTDEARQLHTVQDVTEKLCEACDRTWPGLKDFVRNDPVKDIAGTARRYALAHSTGLSEKSQRNRDIEAWVRFILENSMLDGDRASTAGRAEPQNPKAPAPILSQNEIQNQFYR